MTYETPSVEQIARTICRAYCRLHKRPEWDLLTGAEQDKEVDWQWDLWLVEARAVYALFSDGENAFQKEVPK